MKYQETLGWKYIEAAVTKNDTRSVIDEMVKKYKGTSIECDPIFYELKITAKLIADIYKDRMTLEEFSEMVGEEYWHILYLTDTDIMLLEMWNE